jgi:hypothetical protein
VWRAVLQETLVIVGVALPPSPLRVIAGLLRQNRGLFRLEVDLSFGVVVAIGLIHDAHD